MNDGYFYVLQMPSQLRFLFFKSLIFMRGCQSSELDINSTIKLTSQVMHQSSPYFYCNAPLLLSGSEGSKT